MKFNIYFTMHGPGGTVTDVPNSTNPVECADLASLLRNLMDNLPGGNLGLETVGLRIEQVVE